MDKEKTIVSEFAQKMLEKITERHNRYQPLGWKTMDVKRLITLMKGEIEEMEESLSANDLTNAKKEAVDIANYAMFLHEVIHG